MGNDIFMFYGIKETLISEGHQELSIELRYVVAIPETQGLSKKENYVVVIQRNGKRVFGKKFDTEAEARKFLYSPQMQEEIKRHVK